MHSDWDLVKLDLPPHVFTPGHAAAKGQHYIVHFSSRSPTDHIYTDAIDIHALMKDVDPPEHIYGSTSGKSEWAKTDHCQFVATNGVASPIRDATRDATSCKVDLSKKHLTGHSYIGINVVPAANPDIVPKTVERDVEVVDPICIAGCAPTPSDATVSTAGYCRSATANANVAVCAAPARVHKVTWANPKLSGIEYDAQTVGGAAPGEYIEFEWDDVVHDVWLVPADIEDPCDTTSQTFKDKSTLIIPPSHHATIDQSTEDTFVDGRNRFQIPANASGTTLLFVCTVNGHCKHDEEGHGGMQLPVAISNSPAPPDRHLAEGSSARPKSQSPFLSPLL